MRVQRAPRSIHQPEPAPFEGGAAQSSDGDAARGGLPAERHSEIGAGHASVEVDVTRIRARCNPQALLDEIVRCLLLACHHESVLTADAEAVVAEVTADGLVRRDGSVMGDLSNALLVVPVRRAGWVGVADWGRMVGATAVVGPDVQTLTSPSDDVLTVERRRVVRVSLSSPAASYRLIRALDVVANSMEGA